MQTETLAAYEPPPQPLQIHLHLGGAHVETKNEIPAPVILRQDDPEIARLAEALIGKLAQPVTFENTVNVESPPAVVMQAPAPVVENTFTVPEGALKVTAAVDLPPPIYKHETHNTFSAPPGSIQVAAAVTIPEGALTVTAITPAALPPEPIEEEITYQIEHDAAGRFTGVKGRRKRIPKKGKN